MIRQIGFNFWKMMKYELAMFWNDVKMCKINLFMNDGITWVMMIKLMSQKMVKAQK